MPRGPERVEREVLLARLHGARIVAIEAPGGWGKTELIASLIERDEVAACWARLSRGDGAEGIPNRLQLGAEIAGLSDIARAAAAASPDRAPDLVCAAAKRASDAVAFIVDDVHHAGDSAEFLLRFAEALPPPHRLIVAGRVWPPGLESLRVRPGTVVLGAADLAIAPDEAAALVATRAPDLNARQVGEHLVSLAGGSWAVVALAVERLASSSEPGAALAALLADGSAGRDLARLSLGRLTDSERAVVSQLARLAAVDPQLVDDVTGEPGFFARVVASGAPFARVESNRWELPGPLQDQLASAAPDIGFLRRAAAALAARGSVWEAITALIDAADGEGATETLGRLSPEEAAALDPQAVVAFARGQPDRTLDLYPRTWVHVLFAAERAGDGEMHTRARTRLNSNVDLRTDPWVHQVAVGIEFGMQLWSWSLEEVERVAAGLADAPDITDDGLGVVTQRAGQRLAYHGYYGLDRARHKRGAAMLQRSMTAFRRSGWHTNAWLSEYLHAEMVSTQLAEYDSVVEQTTRVLAGFRAPSVHRVMALGTRSRNLAALGRTAEAASDVAEATELALALGTPVSLAHAAAASAQYALMNDDADADAVLASSGTAETTPSPFLILALALIGADREAQKHLDAFLAVTGDLPLTRLFTLFANAARGDGDAVDELTTTIPTLAFQAMRIIGLMALAGGKRRRGDRTAEDTRRQFVDEATRIGAFGLIAVMALTDPSAGVAGAQAGPIRVRLLGRFDISRAGFDVDAGTPAAGALVALLATFGGRRHRDEVIEDLWPEVEAETGRRRLRNLLNRTRESAGDIIERDGGVLCLPAGSAIDVVDFERAASRALAAREPNDAIEIGRSALALYRGPLLPDEPYAEWVINQRERLERLHLEVIDALAKLLLEAGDLDEAARLVDRAIDLDPYDEDRYLQVAEVRIRQGHRGAARTVLRRLVSRLSELDVPPSDRAAALIQEIGSR